MQSKNVKIELPDINKAEQGFIPNEKNNSIMFGLKGIMQINNDTAKDIIDNRPYNNINDFYRKLILQKRERILSTGKTQLKSIISDGQMLMLIKAGAFDKIETLDREHILEKYLKMINPCKTKLTSRDIGKIQEMGLIPSEFKDIIKIYNFRDYIMTMKKIPDKNTKSIIWAIINDKENIDMNEYANNFFLEHFADDMEEDKDYKYDENGFLMIAIKTKRKGSFEYIYNQKINKILKWIKTEECLNKYNDYIFAEIKKQKMSGNISTWEMESMNYYYHEHELQNVNIQQYDVIDFNKLSLEPKTIGFTKFRNMKYPKFELHRIMGTVLDRNKNKHSISLLTPTGVVTVKFYSGQFSFYDKAISKDTGIDNTGKATKKILEYGWFSRGSKLLITGFRRGDIFKPKRYKNSVYQHSVQKILEVKDDGNLILQSDRIRVE